jgi:mycothiol synthase
MEIPLRPAGPADLEAIFALQTRVERHDRLPIATPLAEFEDWLDDPHLHFATDTRLVETGGQVVAWGRTWHNPSGVREERAYLDGAVDPAHRGRGIGTALITWQVERATEQLRAATATLPRYLRAQAYDFEESAGRLYRRHGLMPVRYLDELLRPLDDLPPVDPPPGIEVGGWQTSLSEEIRNMYNEAYVDNWGSTPLDRPAWEYELGSSGVRLDLSPLAIDGGRVIGASLNAHFPEDVEVTGRRDGWIHKLAVSRSHRGRGIASALIGASLAAFRGAGFDHAMLGVDTENPSGAHHLYQRLGFRPVARSIVYQLEV